MIAFSNALHDRLPIQHEMLVIRVIIQDDQEIVHEVDELQAELLKGLVPFTIPMRMRNNMQGMHKLSKKLRFSSIMPQRDRFRLFQYWESAH